MSSATPPFDLAPAKPGHIVVRSRYVAWRLNFRVLGFCVVALLALAILGLWTMTLGSLDISVADAFRATIGQGDPDHVYVMQQLRLPRVLTAILIGACLAISGAIFQGLVGNPLVSPDVIGINAGASVAAVFWIIAHFDEARLPFAALAGALLAAVVVYLLSWKGGIDPDRMILVGIGITAALEAITTLILLRNPPEESRPAQVWMVGSIYGSNWSDIAWLAPVLLVGLFGAIVLMWPLRVLQLGEDLTRGLGVSLERTRLSLIVIGCGLAAVSVAIAGPIGFVALMSPHIVKMLVGPLSGSVLVLIGITGAIFLLVADVIGQHGLPMTLPVGLVTAAVGGPYFLFLLFRSNTRGLA